MRRLQLPVERLCGEGVEDAVDQRDADTSEKGMIIRDFLIQLSVQLFADEIS